MRRVYGMKVGAQYAGISVHLPKVLMSPRGGVMDGQKSAEGIIVVWRTATKARTCKAKRCRSLRRRRRRR